jgi:hypothetical protein
MSLKINNKQILYPLSGSFIGSFSGSISNAISASYALSASFALTSSRAISASFSVSSSMANNANTASYILPLTQSVLITGSFDHQGTFKVNELTYPIVDNGEESFMQTDGNGNLSLQYVKTIYEEVFNGESTILLKGTPVYVSGSVGAAAKVFRADPTNINKMPAVYIIADNVAPGNPGKGIALGLIKGIDTTGYPAGTEIYLAAGGGWTSTRPTGSTIIQVLGYVTKEGNGGQGVVLNPGPANLPNIAPGNVWVGNASSIPVATPTSSLNVLSASFAVSSSRTVSASFADISISSSFAISSSRAVSASFSNNTISASFAATASFALNAGGGAGFPFVGDAVITGSLTVRSGSIELRVTETGVIIGSSITDIHSVSGSLRVSGSITNIALSGSGNRVVLADPTGSLQPTNQTLIQAYIDPASTNASLLNSGSNWNASGSYIGTTLVGTFQGQKHYNSSYYFEAVDDNVWIRLLRV